MSDAAALPTGAPSEPPGQRRRGLQELLLYGLVRLLALPLQLPPLRLVLWAARRLGTLAYWIDGRHRRVAHRNLELAYGDRLDERQRRRIARGAFQSFLMTIVEGLQMGRLVRSGRMRELLEFSGTPERLREAARHGPLLLFSGHLGSWELLAPGLRRLGVDVIAVARPTGSRWLDDFVVDLRRGGGQGTTIKKGALSNLREAVRAGRSIGMLVDQHQRNGIPIRFFGRESGTHQSPGILAQRLRLPVFVGYVERVIPGRRYRFFCHGPIALAEAPTVGARTAAITQQLTDFMESFVRQRPEQWFWLHRRWKYGRDGEIADGLGRRRRTADAPGKGAAGAPGAAPAAAGAVNESEDPARRDRNGSVASRA